MNLSSDIYKAFLAAPVLGFWVSMTLLTLKALGYIEMRWRFVMAPFCIPAGCCGVMVSAVLLMALAVSGKHHPADHH